MPYTLNPNSEGQFVGKSSDSAATAPKTDSASLGGDQISSTPVPLVYIASSSDTDGGVRDTPVPLVYGAPSSSGGEPTSEDVAGNGCGASVGGARDLTAGAVVLGLAALGMGGRRRSARFIDR